MIDWHAYQKKYEWYSVRRILEEHTGSVIAFGGGQSVYDGTIYAEPFLQLLKNYKYTFLLLPYDDQIKSIKFLDKRITSKDERTLNRIFISSNTNELSAKEVIFVADKTAPEISDEILQKILEQQV